MSRAEPDSPKSLPKSNELLRMLVRILVYYFLEHELHELHEYLLVIDFL